VNPSVTFDRLKNTPTVLPDFPINILKQNAQMKIPLLLGATKQDGEYSLGFVYFFCLVPNKLVNNSSFLREELVPLMTTAVGTSFESYYLKSI